MERQKKNYISGWTVNLENLKKRLERNFYMKNRELILKNKERFGLIHILTGYL